MPQYNFPSNPSTFPKTPQYASFYQATSVSGTYYTVVNVTSGKGILQKITHVMASSNVSNIKITIDGVATVITSSDNAMFENSFGAICYDVYRTQNLLQQVNFNSSLKVEIMINATVAQKGVVEYTLY